MLRTLTQNIFARRPDTHPTTPLVKSPSTSKEYIINAENNTGIMIYATKIQQQKAISFAVTHRKSKISIICRIIPQHSTDEQFTTIINESIETTINILAKIGITDQQNSNHSKTQEIRSIMNYMLQQKNTFCQDAKSCHDAA